MATPKFDFQEIRRALDYFVTPDAVAELRLFNGKGKPVSGYFTDLNIMAQEAVRMSGQASGVYVTLNVVHPELLSRAENCLINCPKQTTSDSEIVKRTRLLIDIDPVRDGTIPSSGEEHDLAIERARDVQAFLRGQGWPATLLVDSGNGAHVLAAVDLPNDEDSRLLIVRVLTALDIKYSDERVKIDTSVANASRICRVPGTWSAKGTETPERPHRLSCILEAPDELAIVSREQLERLAAIVPVKPDSASNAKGKKGKGLNLDQFVADHNLPVVGQKTWNGKVNIAVLNPCPFDSSHDNRSAVIGQFPEGGMFFRCHHDSCQQRTFMDLRDLVDPDWRAKEKQTRSSNATSELLWGTQTDSELLLAIAQEAQLFHTKDSIPYASYQVNGHWETVEVNSQQFDQMLNHRFFQERGKAPCKQVRDDALGVIKPQALYDGPEQDVFLRVAGYGDKIFLDLANPAWEAVEISADGWKVVNNPPVKFWRPQGMYALPYPAAGGNLSELREFVNLPEQDGLELAVGWLLMALSSTGPYPALILSGEQGSAKSTAACLLRKLIDPNKAPNRQLPRSIHDLMIMAKRSWVIPFDNISNVQNWQADAFCCLVTGSGFSTRQLYKDQEEIIFQASRPLVLNGIGEITTRPDLLDRSVVLHLPRINEGNRRIESELNASFEMAHPRLLGALLTAVSAALANKKTVVLDRLPRMADFARWVVAAEPALPWESGKFLATYMQNRNDVLNIPMDVSPLVAALEALMANTNEWTGTMTELYEALVAQGGGGQQAMRQLPTSPKMLSEDLGRLAPNLHSIGLNYEQLPREAKRRGIRITKNITEM